MKFLIDEQLPPRLAEWLDSQVDWSAIHVSQLGLRTDREIADYAAQNGFVVMSKDDDFVTLRLPSRFPLIWLRLGNCHNDDLLRRLSKDMAMITQLISQGEMLVEVR